MDSAPRRSKRSLHRANYTESCYPDGPPLTDFETAVDVLNREAFLAAEYCNADDIIVYSLFATKRRNKSYRALIPATSLEPSRKVTPEEGVRITSLCHQHIQRENPSREACHCAAVALTEEYGHLFSPSSVTIVEQ